MKTQKTVAKVAKLGLVALLPLAATPQQAQAADNIAEIAMSAPQFTTLVTAVKAAGLAPALKGGGQLTVFAPTNAAFAKLPAGTLEMLLKPENKATLASILKYHVVGMKAPARTVTRMKSGANVKTLNGESFAVRLQNGVMLDSFGGGKANVTKTDIMASNGVIHVIDTVLIPPSVMRAMMQQKNAMDTMGDM